MNVLIGCECTGTIRDAFRARGHDAYSCDLLSDQSGNSPFHIQDDILKVLDSEVYRLPDGAMAEKRLLNGAYWDLFIVHPDCTYLTISAEWCYKDIELQTKKLSPAKLYGEERRIARKEALLFVRRILVLSSDIPKFCMENPVGKINTEIMKPTQYIQPYDFGHDASKKTGLWLRDLPELQRTEYVHPRWSKDGLPRWANQTDSGQNNLPPSKDRWLLRAATYPGWADAMAEQWGGFFL